VEQQEIKAQAALHIQGLLGQTPSDLVVMP